MHRIRLRGQHEGSDLEAELFLPALGLGKLGGFWVLLTASPPIPSLSQGLLVPHLLLEEGCEKGFPDPQYLTDEALQC